MIDDPRRAALLAYLKEVDESLYAKTLQLHRNVEGWLRYTTVSFPHYTSHAVDHSVRIIFALSKLLFMDDLRPIIRLSAMEAYILCAAAYLHDSGMVVTDAEQEEILASQEWKQWASVGDTARQIQVIEAFRADGELADPTLRSFLADRQTRYLLAEFTRRRHHERARVVINGHAVELSQFDLGKTDLRNTIAAVCTGHGLRSDELLDADRYPLRRDISYQSVNVRLLALLLRLGDLLDMDSDRACPLVASAVDRMPSSSVVHWTQYHRIEHFLITPSRIEIRAAAETHEEYRLLTDWCQWLVQEVEKAPALLANSTLHAEWRPPEARIGPGGTIQIVPSPNATFIPSSWKFELDADAVYERFIRDSYRSPLAFVRELLQNALDASRCIAYLSQVDRPKYPTQMPEEVRSRFPICVRLEVVQVKNELSGAMEDAQVLSVIDNGIGMDADTIGRFLLQVGRSYYRTDEFRRLFGFIPTSRFGIGFLSVFSISEHVEVDTFREGSVDGPIKLTLTGPRNYLITERGSRKDHGTTVRVRLSRALPANTITSEIEKLCFNIEFPVEVDDLGSVTHVRRERPDRFTTSVQSVVDDCEQLVVDAVPVTIEGVEGYMYVFARRKNHSNSYGDL